MNTAPAGAASPPILSRSVRFGFNAPPAPRDGELWLDRGDLQLRAWDGAAGEWIDIGSAPGAGRARGKLRQLIDRWAPVPMIRCPACLLAAAVAAGLLVHHAAPAARHVLAAIQETP